MALDTLGSRELLVSLSERAPVALVAEPTGNARHTLRDLTERPGEYIALRLAD